MQGIEFKLWFYLPDQDVCACVPAKCGGTSFYRAMFNVPDDVPSEHVRSHAVLASMALGRGPYSVNEVMHYHYKKRKIMAVRDPVERFRSLWRDKYRPDGTSPERLLELIRQHPFADAHWAPQYAWAVPDTRFVLYYDLPGVLGYDRHERKTHPSSADPGMPVSEIEEHYALDRRVLERVVEQ